jgi:hypothetical protein
MKVVLLLCALPVFGLSQSYADASQDGNILLYEKAESDLKIGAYILALALAAFVLFQKFFRRTQPQTH